MIFINGEPGKKTETKLMLLLCAVVVLGLNGIFWAQEINSPTREPGLRALLVVLFLLSCAMLFILYRADISTGFEVDASGIRVVIGKKTEKTAAWQEFCYVGDLIIFPPFARSSPTRVILCSPEQPWLMYGYTDVYGFRRKGAIAISYSPEAEQIMKPYYKGTLSADK